jgi:hypothetical protein
VDFSVKGGARYATVKVRNAAAIPHVLMELGTDPSNVLRRVGLEPDAFSNLDNALSYRALGRLIAECVRETGREDFGLRVGARMGATAIGLTGLVSLNAPTVREALEVIAGGLKTSDTGGALVLETRGAEACARYVVAAPGVEGADQIVDGAMAILVNTLRAVCGAAWRASRVSLTRDPPRAKAPFSRFFDAPVEFAAPLAGVTFDAATLDWPVCNRNPEYADILAPLHQEAVASARGDIVSAVRSILRVQIAGGAATRNGVARALGLNPRTLAHRLGGVRRHLLRARRRGPVRSRAESLAQGQAHCRGRGRSRLRRAERFHPRVHARVGNDARALAPATRRRDGVERSELGPMARRALRRP